MKCKWSKDNISAYIDGGLNIITKWRLQRHIRGCAECQKELKVLQKINDLTKSLLINNPDFDFYEKIQTKINLEKARPYEKPKALGNMWTFLPQSGKASIVAGVAALLFFLILYPRIFSAPSLNIEQFEEEYLRSRETISWMDSPVLSATFINR